MFDVIIAASGESTRFGLTKNKLLVRINEYTVLENAVRPFLSLDGLEKIIIAASEGLFDEISSIAKKLDGRIVVCKGGATRTETIKKALAYVSAEYVLIHDGARPFVVPALIGEVLKGAIEKGAAVPLVSVDDSVADVSDGYTPVERAKLRAVQTPQGFRTSLIKEAYSSIEGAYTDDASVYKTKFTNISIVHGYKSNRKITVFDDILVPICRVGVGFDTHRLVGGRRLILGGVGIPHDKGLLGYSDADVLTHAVMDALLSAAGLRDIGFYFPDDDKRFEDADSMRLLEDVLSLVREEGYVVNNLSATILAEKPKLMTFIPKIIDRLSAALAIDKSKVAILATTTEGVGLIGMEEAISAIATATIIKQ